jgi:undecaprenyl-diphosphatase
LSLFQILLLALVQGAAELLPVSSSAHVIVAEKLLRIDPTTPEATLLLVVLHTGTMLAVALYFWKAWKRAFFASRQTAWQYGQRLVFATFLTGIVGLGLKFVIEKLWLRAIPHAQIEMIFGNLPLMAASLAVGGLLILFSGLRKPAASGEHPVDLADSARIGLVQGLCLPFRGFSRSGATISTGLIREVSRPSAEEFSFALAILLTPPVLYREIHRAAAVHAFAGASALALRSLLGLAFSFLAGLLALKWLSRWLESGRWHYFGIYCLVASAVVLGVHLSGF